MKTIILLLSLIMFSCSVEYATTSKIHNTSPEPGYQEASDTTSYVDNDFSLYLNPGHYPFIYNPYWDPFLWGLGINWGVGFGGFYDRYYYPYHRFRGMYNNRFHYYERQNYIGGIHRSSGLNLRRSTSITGNGYTPIYSRPRYNIRPAYNVRPYPSTLRPVTKNIPSRVVTPYRYNYSPSRMTRSYSGRHR